MRDPAGVSTPLTAGYVLFAGQGANGWFDNSICQTLRRTDEVHNLELNFVRHRLLSDCNCPLCVDVSSGIRFFRFRDDLDWGAECGYVATTTAPGAISAIRRKTTSSAGRWQ